jgi:hypothetical protein
VTDSTSRREVSMLDMVTGSFRKKGGFYVGYGNRQLQEEIIGNFILLFIILYWVTVHIL